LKYIEVSYLLGSISLNQIPWHPASLIIRSRQLWDDLRLTRARDYLPTQAESPWGAPGALPLKETQPFGKIDYAILGLLMVLK